MKHLDIITSITNGSLITRCQNGLEWLETDGFIVLPKELGLELLKNHENFSAKADKGEIWDCLK